MKPAKQSRMRQNLLCLSPSLPVSLSVSLTLCPSICLSPSLSFFLSLPACLCAHPPKTFSLGLLLCSSQLRQGRVRGTPFTPSWGSRDHGVWKPLSAGQSDPLVFLLGSGVLVWVSAPGPALPTAGARPAHPERLPSAPWILGLSRLGWNRHYSVPSGVFPRAWPLS